MPKKRAAFKILGQSIEPGKSARINLDVAKLHTSTPIQVPVIVHHAKKPGPVLLLLAGAHGDEINGIEIVRKIIKRGWNKPEAGTVVCIPVYNIFAFLNLSREFPDGRDLNRSFPGALNGSLASQFAFHFMRGIAPHVDIIIDFHTGGGQRSNFQQTRCDFKDEKNLLLCKAFGAPFILHSPLINKSLRAEMHKMNKTYILFEGGKANRTNPDVVNAGVLGVQNIMTHLGMRNFKLEKSVVNPVLLNSSKWLRAPNSGMLAVKIKNGDYIEKGDLLARIGDPYGTYERSFKSPSSGYIINVNESPLVNRGDAIFHLASEKES
jgi:predicted deacylase